jgi:hypothetical protein
MAKATFHLCFTAIGAAMFGMVVSSNHDLRSFLSWYWGVFTIWQMWMTRHRLLESGLPVADNTYECAMCGETYEKTWSDEEAIAEMNQYFGDVPVEDCDVVCDDCFQKIHPKDHPEEVAAAKRTGEGR